MSTVDQDRIAIEAGFQPIPAIYDENGDCIQVEMDAFTHYAFVHYGGTKPCPVCRLFEGHTKQCLTSRHRERMIDL